MAITLDRPAADPYMDLVKAFPLRPIRSRAAHARAKAMLRGLAGPRGPAARDYRLVLASLVADYERTAHLRLDTSRVTPADVVRHLLAERGMTVNALAKTLGISQSSLSDVLNGRRDWSKEMIVRVSRHFALQPAMFLR